MLKTVLGSLAVALLAAAPVSAMPLAPTSATASAHTTPVQYAPHYRHDRGYHYRRHGSLANGKRGFGPTENMSKTNGGRGGGS